MARRPVLVRARFDVVRSRAADTGVGLTELDLPPTSWRSFCHLIFQSLRLRIELFRGAGALLRARGIALGDLIQLRNGGVDLLDTLSLLSRGNGDFRDKRVGSTHPLGNLRKRLLDLGRALRSLFRLLTIAASILSAVSLAAAALRWASDRTSSATTAKPAPASPARAASTAAFRARMFVWKAISSIFLTILATSALDESIAAIA